METEFYKVPKTFLPLLGRLLFRPVVSRLQYDNERASAISTQRENYFSGPVGRIGEEARVGSIEVRGGAVPTLKRTPVLFRSREVG